MCSSEGATSLLGLSSCPSQVVLLQEGSHPAPMAAKEAARDHERRGGSGSQTAAGGTCTDIGPHGHGAELREL